MKDVSPDLSSETDLLDPAIWKITSVVVRSEGLRLCALKSQPNLLGEVDVIDGDPA